MIESVSFRFLDLPEELRFIVYENLSVSIKELRLLAFESSLHIEQKATGLTKTLPAITLTLQTLPIQILSTCQLVYSEALPFLSRKLDKIRETYPKIIMDADCLSTSASKSTQKLLCAILDHLDQHLFLQSKPATMPPMCVEVQPQYGVEVCQWLTQTTHLLLSQRSTSCPLSGFMGISTYPTVRLLIEVPKILRYSTCRGIASELRAHENLHAFMASITSDLSQVYSELIDYTKRLKHVKSGAIVFGQEDEKVLTKHGLVVRKTVALDFGTCRVIG